MLQFLILVSSSLPFVYGEKKLIPNITEILSLNSVITQRFNISVGFTNVNFVHYNTVLYWFHVISVFSNVIIIHKETKVQLRYVLLGGEGYVLF